MESKKVTKSAITNGIMKRVKNGQTFYDVSINIDISTKVRFLLG